eukprot:g5933.t1
MVCGESLTPDKKYKGRLVLHGTQGWRVNNQGYLDPQDHLKAQANFEVDLTKLTGEAAGTQNQYGFYIHQSKVMHKEVGKTVSEAITLTKHNQAGGGNRGEAIDNMMRKFWSEGTVKAAKTFPCQLKLDFDKNTTDYKLFGKSFSELTAEKKLKTTGRCFKCNVAPGTWTDNFYPIFCGRDKPSSNAKSPSNIAARAGTLGVKWYQKKWGEGCDFWGECHSLNLMDRVAGRVWKTHRQFKDIDPNDFLNKGGNIYVCGESTWSEGSTRPRVEVWIPAISNSKTQIVDLPEGIESVKDCTYAMRLRGTEKYSFIDFGDYEGESKRTQADFGFINKQQFKNDNKQRYFKFTSSGGKLTVRSN